MATTNHASESQIVGMVRMKENELNGCEARKTGAIKEQSCTRERERERGTEQSGGRHCQLQCLQFIEIVCMRVYCMVVCVCVRFPCAPIDMRARDIHVGIRTGTAFHIATHSHMRRSLFAIIFHFISTISRLCSASRFKAISTYACVCVSVLSCVFCLC